MEILENAQFPADIAADAVSAGLQREGKFPVSYTHLTLPTIA